MSAEMWTIITTGIVILIAIATANRSLRRELSERISAVESRLSDRIDRLSERVNAVESRLSERIDRLSERVSAVESRLSERMEALAEHLGDVRERLGRVEGLLEGLGMVRRQQAGKRRGDGKRTPTPPV